MLKAKIQEQEQQMMQQDEVLNKLRESVRKQKDAAIAMSNKLDEEHKELDEKLAERGIFYSKKSRSPTVCSGRKSLRARNSGLEYSIGFKALLTRL